MKSIKPIVIAIIIITAVVGILYAIMSGNIFDTSGNYIKGMTGDKDDRLTFEETAEVPDYQSILDDWEQFKDKKIYYYCEVSEVEREVKRHTDQYFCLAIINEEATKNLKDPDKYAKTTDGKAVVPLLVKLKPDEVGSFNVGDSCFVYGYLKENEEYGEYESIPVIDARKIKLDLEEED